MNLLVTGTAGRPDMSIFIFSKKIYADEQVDAFYIRLKETSYHESDVIRDLLWTMIRMVTS